MVPTLSDGDLLLVDRGVRVRPGALVVARMPGAPLAVKRARFWHSDDEARGWWLERDNPQEGTDSWAVGPVAPKEVVAVVLGRLWPRPRVLLRRGEAPR
jgi:hypothetical protein